MEIDTSRIDLERESILHQGDWLTADDLKAQIQEKMESGDMKFATLASLLEELNTAIESSQVVETKIILSKDQYEKLSLLSNGEINDGVRKAILAFIEDEKAQSTAGDTSEDTTDDVEFVVQNGEIEQPPASSGLRLRSGNRALR